MISTKLIWAYLGMYGYSGMYGWFTWVCMSNGIEPFLAMVLGLYGQRHESWLTVIYIGLYWHDMISEHDEQILYYLFIVDSCRTHDLLYLFNLNSFIIIVLFYTLYLLYLYAYLILDIYWVPSTLVYHCYFLWYVRQQSRVGTDRSSGLGVLVAFELLVNPHPCSEFHWVIY